MGRALRATEDSPFRAIGSRQFSRSPRIPVGPHPRFGDRIVREALEQLDHVHYLAARFVGRLPNQACYAADYKQDSTIGPNVYQAIFCLSHITPNAYANVSARVFLPRGLQPARGAARRLQPGRRFVAVALPAPPDSADQSSQVRTGASRAASPVSSRRSAKACASPINGPSCHAPPKNEMPSGRLARAPIGTVTLG